MKYKRYTKEDFLLDEFFQKWILENDEMTNNFWENWLKENTDKKEEIASAAEFVNLMAVGGNTLSEQEFDGMWQGIVEKRKDDADTFFISKVKRNYGKLFLRTAAIFVGLIAMGSGIYFSGLFDEIDVEYPETEITLQLQDGTTKIIDIQDVEVVTDAKGKSVANQNKTKLNYAHSDTRPQTLLYNTLKVPYGKNFQVVLSDGSLVYLNSGTSLRYPVQFLEEAPRNVYLDGEAYFIVEKDETRPFAVITDEMNTRVYGTEFNVSSYKNEENTFTVLVEGSVSVYRSNNGDGQKAIKITPGQRAVFDSNDISVQEVAVEKYIAWRKGELFFMEDRFELIVKELERHFDIEIHNKYGDLNRKLFTGTFKDETLDYILRVFSEHTPFDYSVNGKVVTLTRK